MTILLKMSESCSVLEVEKRCSLKVALSAVSRTRSSRRIVGQQRMAMFDRHFQIPLGRLALCQDIDRQRIIQMIVKLHPRA